MIHFYEKYNKYELALSKEEEKTIQDTFDFVYDGNSSIQEMSQPELNNAFWLFRHGWIAGKMKNEIH